MKQILDFVHPHIRAIAGYVPGYQTESAEFIKLNTNENPYPVPDRVREALHREVDAERLQRYPDPVAAPLRTLLAAHCGTTPDNILIANGSDEILSILFRTVCGPGDSFVTASPTYSLYPTLASLVQASTTAVALKDDWRMNLAEMLLHARTAKLTAIVNPNAPTGIPESSQDILAFARSSPSLTLVDEAYAPFGVETLAPQAGRPGLERLLVCGTFSKAMSLAGMRIGWIVAHPEFVREMEKVKDSYNVSRLAQAAATAALEDFPSIQKHIDEIVETREFLRKELTRMGFDVLPSAANFLYVSPPDGRGREYFEYLRGRKILVRYFPEGRGEKFVRITIGTREQINALISSSDLFLKSPTAGHPASR
ncbi:MAG: histidinol-phosphate transaminase [Spirochaetia bacterium]|nr:histidinol-phosphate transaminase [Spirochaetia bacterium]